MVDRLKIFLNIALLCFSTYSQADSPSNFEDGEHLFRTAGGYGCSTCHGMYAQGGGNVGGNIRGKSLEDINKVLDNEPTMTLLSEVLNSHKRQLLGNYLTALGEIPLVEWIIEDKPSQKIVSIDNGQVSQLVILNKLFEPVDLSISPVNSTSLQISPYETQAFQWTPEPGVIQLKYKQSVLEIHIK